MIDVRLIFTDLPVVDLGYLEVGFGFRRITVIPRLVTSCQPHAAARAAEAFRENIYLVEALHTSVQWL